MQIFQKNLSSCFSSFLGIFNEFHCKCNNTHLHISFYNSAKQDCNLEAENVFLQTLESSFSLLLSIFQCKLIYVYFDSEDGANYYYYCWYFINYSFFVEYMYVETNWGLTKFVGLQITMCRSLLQSMEFYFQEVQQV